MYSSNFSQQMIHSVFEIKLWGIKQIFVTVNLKFKVKIYFYEEGGSYRSPQPSVLELYLHEQNI